MNDCRVFELASIIVDECLCCAPYAVSISNLLEALAIQPTDGKPFRPLLLPEAFLLSTVSPDSELMGSNAKPLSRIRIRQILLIPRLRPLRALRIVNMRRRIPQLLKLLLTQPLMRREYLLTLQPP